jgi:SAM-dependent methyltransferase
MSSRTPHPSPGSDPFGQQPPTAQGVEEHPEGIVTITSHAATPRRLSHQGHVLERFMDTIYVPATTEELTPSQIQVVNRLRRELVDSGKVEPADHDVKVTFGSLASSIHARAIIDWGCGYHTLRPYLPADVTRFVGVDLDPDVVADRRVGGDEAYTCDEVAALDFEPFDLGFSVFVWHFDVRFQDLVTIKRLLGGDGVFIANVYRRDGSSRERLAESVRQAGFLLDRQPDKAHLCRDHEYWTLRQPGARLPPQVHEALS